MPKLNRCLSGSTLILAALFANVTLLYAADHTTAKIKPPSGDAIALQRISLEPFGNLQTTTLRWSPDSSRAAWLQLVRPAPKAIDKSILYEIWALDAHSDLKTAHVLVTADKITKAIQDSGPPIHRRSDDDGEDSNPYRLQDFLWSSDHASVLLIGLRSLTWLELASGKAKTLVSGDETLSSVQLSPDGHNVAFLRAHKLWIADSSGRSARLFTAPSQEGVLTGELDWPYRNELHLGNGYWWSPNSTQVAYLQIDDRKVDKYAMHESDGTAREIVYPKPGGELPLVRVFVKRLTGGVPLEIQLGKTAGFYIPRVTWLPDGHHLAIERLDRHQRTLELLLADTVTGKVATLLTEQDKYWINLSQVGHDPYFLNDGKRFLWTSERSGFRHIYMYDLQGKQLAQLTHGDWEVTGIDAVDEAKNSIYLTATEKSLLERHLYEVKFDASAPVRLSQKPGTHTALFAPDTVSFVDEFSSQTSPPTAEILTVGGAAPSSFVKYSPVSEADGKAQVATPQPIVFLDLKTHLGLPVHAFTIKPPSFDASHKYPVIVYLAGGPGEQLVRDAWGGPTGLWMQLMAQNGYIVFALDNQGTAGRGHYFEEPIHLRLAGMELADQRDGLQYLSDLPYVDTSRIGVAGWGYGGFLVVHAMLDRPLPFKAGFAGAPVTNWHYYDAIFGERYLDDPVAFADGWDASTALENAKNLKGSLLIAQGTLDEFVHLENAYTLQDELVDAGKAADFLLLPDRGHQIDDAPAKLVLFSKMTEFFLKNL